MAVQIDKFSKFLCAAVQAVEGTPATTLKLYRTLNLNPDIYAGDQKKRQYDGDSGRFTPTVTTNEQNKFSFDVPFAGSGAAATIPAIDDLLRIGGLSRVAATAPEVGFDYLIGSSGDTDSGTLLMREVVGGVEANGDQRYYYYQTADARGYVGIECKVNEDPIFKLVDVTGSYIRPTSVLEPSVSLEYLDQQEAMPFGYTSVPQARLGDPTVANTWHDVCLHSFSIGNYSGFTISKSNAVNCPRTVQQPTPIEGSFTIKQLDWTDEFNIYEAAESHNGYKTLPFQMTIGTVAGNTIKIDIEKLQITKVARTELDDGSMGVDISFICLANPVLKFR